jgi:DnaD/phage-associated family protein
MNDDRKIITEISGFTPIFDVVVDEYKDETIAAVFGAIWRFCQLEDGVCKASLETISQSIGVDKVTVMRHAKTLCTDGFLKDLTPDLKNRPHIYAETGRVCMKSRLETVSQRNVGVSQRNATVSQRNATVSLSHLNRVFNKDSEEKERFKNVARKLSELSGGALNATTASFLNEWLPRHEDKWIFLAIETAEAKGARSIKYVDSILCGWESNGYPKTREQRVEEKSRSSNSRKVDFYKALGVQKNG